MNEKEWDIFLLELRRDKEMATTEVAEAINVSEEELVKWEDGTKLPEMDQVQPLADFYGVTVNELLRGERYSLDKSVPSEHDVTQNVLEYANNNMSEQFKHTRREWLIAITEVLAFVIVACLIIDFLSVNAITWSGIASVSILFAWGIILPLFFRLTTPIMSSLIAFSVLIIPYLFLLNLVISANNILVNVAIPITIVSLIYFWALYFIYTRMHLSSWRYLAVAAFGLVPVVIIINLVISMQFNMPLFTVWNVLGVLILIAIGVGLVYFEREKLKKKRLVNQSKTPNLKANNLELKKG